MDNTPPSDFQSHSLAADNKLVRDIQLVRMTSHNWRTPSIRRNPGENVLEEDTRRKNIDVVIEEAQNCASSMSNTELF